jgi:hypothetical protein
MQSGCKADAKSLASCHHGCKLHAKTAQSGRIPSEGLQTRCKLNAKTVRPDRLFGSAPRTPSLLGGNIDGPGTPNPGPRRRGGGKGLTAAIGLPAHTKPISDAPIRSISMPFRHTDRHGSPRRSVGCGRRSAKRSRLATPSATSGGNWLSTDLRSHIRTSGPTSVASGNPTRTSRPSTASRSLPRRPRPTYRRARPRSSDRGIPLPEPPQRLPMTHWRTCATA